MATSNSSIWKCLPTLLVIHSMILPIIVPPHGRTNPPSKMGVPDSVSPSDRYIADEAILLSTPFRAALSALLFAAEPNILANPQCRPQMSDRFHLQHVFTFCAVCFHEIISPRQYRFISTHSVTALLLLGIAHCMCDSERCRVTFTTATKCKVRSESTTATATKHEVVFRLRLVYYGIGF